MSAEQVGIAEIENIARRALCAAGARDENAKPLAAAIADAEAEGVASHGLAYLPTYCAHLQCGKVDGQAVPVIDRPRPGTIRADAKSGFAHPAIAAAADPLTAAAKECGIAGLAVRNSYNCGVLGFHTGRLAARNFLALGFTNAPASIAPSGGKKAVLGTNPFSLAVPDGDGGAAILIDQSASDDSDGNALAPGTRLVQSDLARTLRLIARHGQAGFYRGPVAEAIVRTMKTDGGLLTLEDLANYKVVEREPIQGNYRGNRVFAMPPPSSGGIHLVQMLNILEGYDLKSMGRGSAQSIHLLAEAMKPAFADRSVHLGDSDFFAVPAEWLTSKAYATQLRSRIEPGRARTPQEVRPGRAPAKESEDTTHFSVVDAQGNAVSNTYTLNFSYGSGIMVPGTGILLNNEMDDFSAKAGTPNAFGLLGNEANAVEPGKRPLSSMTPTLMFDAQGSLRLVTGSPGGSRIITAVLQHVVDIVDFGLNISESAAAPRMHHQWQPPMLFHESGFSPDTLSLLKSRGHDLRPTRFFGALQSIAIAPDGSLMGMSDPRRPDGKPAGY